MQTCLIKIKKLDKEAIIPKYGTDAAAGFDLYSLSNEEILLEPHETVMIKTGLALEIPEGYAGFIFARSGLASKKGLAPANKVGVVDSDYRGEVMVALHNHTNINQTINAHERIAQMVIMPYIKASFIESEDLEESVRGEGGFGSTGTN